VFKFTFQVRWVNWVRWVVGGGSDDVAWRGGTAVRQASSANSRTSAERSVLLVESEAALAESDHSWRSSVYE
jgi:hypothetical protein